MYICLMPNKLMLCYFMLCYVMLCCVALRCVALRCVMSCHVMSCHVMLCYVIMLSKYHTEKYFLCNKLYNINKSFMWRGMKVKKHLDFTEELRLRKRIPIRRT